MTRFVAILAATVALAAAPVHAEPAKVQVIVADNSAECGIYRLAMHKREDNERTARKLAREYEARGIKTRVIVIHPGEYVGAVDQAGGNFAPIYQIPQC